MIRTRFASTVLLLLAAALLPCAVAAAPAEGPVVLAAASLQEVLSDAADIWAAKEQPRPVLSFAGTPALARQAAAGAPAGLIVTADAQWMDWLAERGVIRQGSRRTLACGRLVIVSRRPREWIGSAAQLTAALNGGRLAVAGTDAVPAGRYAKAALQRLGSWEKLRLRLASAESVRGALAMVERGAAPLGIVYETDARAAAGIHVAGRFRPQAHPPICYTAALLKAGSGRPADAFLRFLESGEGRAIFRARGFAAS